MRDIDNDGYPDIIYVALDYEVFPLFRTWQRQFADITAASGIAG